MEPENNKSILEGMTSPKTIPVSRELFSLATVLAAAYEMQAEAYFNFKTNKEKIIITVSPIEESKEEKQNVEREFLNNLARFAWYELNLANKIALRWLNNKQYYYYFDYSQNPEDFFDEEFLSEEPNVYGQSQEFAEEEPAPSLQEVPKEEPAVQEETEPLQEPEKPELFDDNAEIDDVDDFDKIIIDDASGISTPWEVKHGETKNK
ncbi:MAG TPA: hypothetical protein ENN46_01660 [Candidatus Woesearchaeota archaeon]|nr:hypothetical protein [Candidatus Woesearchaeota archaeon]